MHARLLPGLAAAAVISVMSCSHGSPTLSELGGAALIAPPAPALPGAASALAGGASASPAPAVAAPPVAGGELAPPAPASSGGAGAWVDHLADAAGLRERPPRAQRQWNHIAAAAGAECRDALKSTGARFQPIPDTQKPNKKGCGIPRGVLLRRGPTGVVYSPPLQIDCSLALRLVDIERVIQEEAEAHLGSPITRISTLGSYACREVVGRMRKWSEGLSEHSFGNAFDIARFTPKRGRAISVLRDYVLYGKEPSTREGHFLRSVTRRLRADGAASRVLGPDFDASHRDHLHVDCGTPRWY
ncbi:extensin family protein [Sorangium cellulosum]|uniref:extensin-like domain-containing protein n=1 Tax=Sorangium cellulosum TaxID=56 RepID=UPI000A5680AF|nr:extensin family protein [Sorangium cellulosum]